VDIGGAIAGLRTAAGLSQQELADLLFVDRTLVSKWESGQRRPDYHMIENIAAVFKVDGDRIADRKDLVFAELAECVPEGLSLSGEELTAVTERFIRSLSAGDAQIFLKRYYFLKMPKEIGDELGLRPGTVRKMLFKIRAGYRVYLKEAASWTERTFLTQ